MGQTAVLELDDTVDLIVHIFQVGAPHGDVLLALADLICQPHQVLDLGLVQVQVDGVSQPIFIEFGKAELFKEVGIIGWTMSAVDRRRTVAAFDQYTARFLAVQVISPKQADKMMFPACLKRASAAE